MRRRETSMTILQKSLSNNNAENKQLMQQYPITVFQESQETSILKRAASSLGQGRMAIVLRKQDTTEHEEVKYGKLYRPRKCFRD